MNIQRAIPYSLNPGLFNWVPKGKLFYSGDTPLTSKGYTAFPLLDRFEKGIDTTEWEAQFEGFNNPRIFFYVGSGWGADMWNLPSKEATLEFLKYQRSKGKVVSYCICTDNDSNKVEAIKEIVNHLKGKVDNLLIEAVNEPGIHDKLDPSVFKNLLSGSGYPYCSGWYIDNTKHYGTYWNDHSARNAAWFSKGGHNIYEACHTGGGPNHKGEPALKQPGRQDEPIKPSECGYDYLGFYAYAASCVLLGTGATFHCESAKFCRMLTPDELKCKDFFLQGLNAFPPIDYYQYDRIEEPGQHPDARTYINGSFAVRIKQEGTSFPEPGWTSLDEYGICWVRV